MADEIDRVTFLVEEWKLLAGYVDRGFRSIEAQALQIALLLAAGIGSFHENVVLPKWAWLLIAPAVFAMMLRMKSQAAFTFFQSERITAIEDEINRLLATSNEQRVFYYAHRVAELSPRLGKMGCLYPYPVWTLFLDLLGMVIVGYSTVKASCFLLGQCYWRWAAWPFGCFFILAILWYGAATAVILYRFFKAVEGHPKKCSLLHPKFPASGNEGCR